MFEMLTTPSAAPKSARGPRQRATRMSAFIAVAATATLVLAGCGSDGEPAASTAILEDIPTIASCPEPASVTIWALQNSDAQSALDESMASAFEKQCEGTQITYQYYPGASLAEKITTVMVAGTPPTAIQPTDPVSMKTYIDSGQLLNAGKLMKTVDPEWESKFVPSSLDRTKLYGDEEVYGFPAWGASPLVLWYNKQVFEKAGIANPPETLEELDEDIAKFKDAGIIPIALGNADKSPSTFWAQYLTEREAGSDPFKAVMAGEPNAWSNKGIVEALTQLQEKAENGAFGVGFDSTGNQNGADRALFYTGRAAMMLANANFISKVASAAPEFVESDAVGYVEVPQGKHPTKSLVGNSSVNYFITSKSSEAEQKLIATYFSTMLSSGAYAKGTASIGVVPAVANAENLIPTTVLGKSVLWSYKLAGSTKMQPVWTSSLGNYNAVVQENAAAVTNGSMTPQQFADTMNKTIK